MALTIKSIEAENPKIDRVSGKAKLVRLAEDNGLYLEITKKARSGGLWRERPHCREMDESLSSGRG